MTTQELIEAAIAWRQDWPDDKDLIEADEGCGCSVCRLIRACDGYLEPLIRDVE